ncbi:hypothetical protein V5799_016311 [Amblyomma americanum]|uniref:Uncharacterized protein n=1 Tax=Amblyomma americanum TaxID=6943 RepID=A0AAQ4F650_AMBAM
MMPSLDSDDTATSSWMGPCLDTSLFDESASCETFEQFFRTTTEGSSCEMNEEAVRDRCEEEGEPSGTHGESREQEDGEAPLLQRCEWESREQEDGEAPLLQRCEWESREQEDGEVPLLQRCEWHMSVEQLASPEKEDHPTVVDEDGEPYKVQEVTSAGCDEAAAVEWSTPCLDADLFDDSVNCEIFDEIFRKTTGESVREDTWRGLCKNDEIAAGPSVVNGAEGEEEQEPQCCQNEQGLSLMPMGSPGRTEHPAVDYEEKDPYEIPPRQSDEGLAASWSEVCLDAGVLYEDASDELPEDLLRHLREEPTRQEPRLSSSDEEGKVTTPLR